MEHSEEELEEIQEENENIFEDLEKEETLARPYAHIWTMIIAETAALFLVFAVLAGIKAWKNYPERIASDYVRGMVQGEWNEIYDCMYFSDSEEQLLNKKMFVTAQGLQFDNGIIIRVKVKDAKDTTVKNENRKVIAVDYTRNEEPFTKEVPLIKKDGMWKVDGDKEYVRKDVQIEVPSGALVSYDGVILDESYMKSREGIVDTYSLPKIFDGLHYITLSKENMEKSEELIRFNGEEPVRLTMKYSDEALTRIGIQAQNDISAAYKNADIGSKVFISLNLTGNKVTVKISESDPSLIEATVVSEYNYQYKQNKYYWGTRTSTGSCTNTCVYSYDGTQLQLAGQNLDTSFL